ncbi:MAG: hypothetical protein ACPGTG_05610 [Flavobacteriales bacterium]
MKNKALKLVFVFLTCIGAELKAQSDSVSFFTKRQFGRHLLADHFGSDVKIGFGFSLARDEYDISPKKREVVVYSEPILGVDIPIYLRKTPAFDFSISVPVSFSVWLDFTEKRTAPILNTDYRVAPLELNISRRFKHRNRFLKTIGLKITPLFHESTHLGDELTIKRLQDSIPTVRVNVSYETFNLEVFLNDAYGQMKPNHAFKLGTRILLQKEKGWYSADPLESDTTRIPRSKLRAEYFLQYEYQNPDFLKLNKHSMFVFSADFSARISFGYPIYSQNPDLSWREELKGEFYRLGGNLMVGYKFYNESMKQSRFGVFLRTYWGVNYHGQFRNFHKFPMLGLTMVYTH